MPNELRGRGASQRRRAAEKTAALAGALAGKLAVEQGITPAQPQLPTSGVPGLPPSPPGYDGSLPRQDAGGAGLAPAGGAALPALPQAGAAPPMNGTAPQALPVGAAAGITAAPPAMPPPAPYAKGGVVPGAGTPMEPPPLRPRYGSRRELEAEMLPGVRPIGNVLTAPRIFDIMEQFLTAQREGRELPRFATGGVIAPRSLPDATPELDLGALADMAGLTDEEQALWDGAGADEDAPEMFEDWLVDVAPQSEYAIERDLADLYGNRPELASGLWGLVQSICKEDDSVLSPGLVRMVKSRGKGYRDTNGHQGTGTDIPPTPTEAY